MWESRKQNVQREHNINLKWVVVPTLPDVPHPGRLSEQNNKRIPLDELADFLKCMC